MCGFAGIVNFSKDLADDKPIIQNMTETLAHRGPDGFGYFYDTHALFGHRRLAVVDPEGGAQPMHKTAGGNSFTIIYNGELYNTEELRKDLLALGFCFLSYSDTEVLLASYIAWGPDCTRYLNGIFSFAIWDAREETLFLCRDPLGVKPLFYTAQGDALIFGSELKALLKHPSVMPDIDENSIGEIIGLGPAHSADSGVFKNIKQLPQGHYLLYSREKTVIKEYWSLKEQDHTENEHETQEHIRFLLTDAIRRQLVSDVSVCTFLSGGLDSSLISAVAAEEFGKKGCTLDTFSIDYENNDRFFTAGDFQPSSDDEWAALVSEHIGSRHHRVILNNHELVSALEQAVCANDLPGMADIDSSLLLFCYEVKKHATVALSGECADEIFGGYPWYVREDLAYSNTFPWSGAVKERAKLLSPELKHIDIIGYVESRYNDSISKAPCDLSKSAAEAEHKKLFYLNVKWFMNTLLTRKDRMSMASSLEVRVPFADHRLVEYAFNIPKELLFLNGREKGLLRKSLYGLLPHDVLWRKKSPYPKTFHPEYTERVCSIMNQILHDTSSPILQIIDADKIQKLVETKGGSFGRPWFGQLMTGPQLIAYLIQLDIWMRKYKVRLCV
jgi:asparagine synthase (glutamine-hydrolysing)